MEFTVWGNCPIHSIPIILPDAQGREILETLWTQGAVGTINSRYADSPGLKALCILKAIPYAGQGEEGQQVTNIQSLNQNHMETSCHLSVIRGHRT